MSFLSLLKEKLFWQEKVEPRRTAAEWFHLEMYPDIKLEQEASYWREVGYAEVPVDPPPCFRDVGGEG